MPDIDPRFAISWTIRDGSELARAIRASGIRRVAEECAVSAQTVCNWLDGTPVPDLKMLAICQMVGWELPYLRLQDQRTKSPELRATRISFTGGKRGKGTPEPGVPNLVKARDLPRGARGEIVVER